MLKPFFAIVAFLFPVFAYAGSFYAFVSGPNARTQVGGEIGNVCDPDARQIVPYVTYVGNKEFRGKFYIDSRRGCGSRLVTMDARFEDLSYENGGSLTDDCVGNAIIVIKDFHTLSITWNANKSGYHVACNLKGVFSAELKMVSTETLTSRFFSFPEYNSTAEDGTALWEVLADKLNCREEANFHSAIRSVFKRGDFLIASVGRGGADWPELDYYRVDSQNRRLGYFRKYEESDDNQRGGCWIPLERKLLVNRPIADGGR